MSVAGLRKTRTSEERRAKEQSQQAYKDKE